MRNCDKCGIVLIDEKGDVRNHPKMMDSAGKIFLCNDCADYCKIRTIRYGITAEEILAKEKKEKKEVVEVEKKVEPKPETKAPVKKAGKKKGGSKK